jgi:hypothetical protein
MTLFPGGYFTQAKNDKKAKKAYEQNSHENCMAAAGAAICVFLLFAGLSAACRVHNFS